MKRDGSVATCQANASPTFSRIRASRSTNVQRSDTTQRGRSLFRLSLAVLLGALAAGIALSGLPVLHATPATQSGAQDGPNPKIETQLSTQVERASLGQPITLTLQVVHPSGWTAIPQRVPQEWGDFELRWQAAPVTSRLDSESASKLDRMRTTQEIGLRPWMTGSLQTPALPVTLVAPDAVQTISMSAEGARIQVRSVLPPGETLPRDIRPQALVPAGRSPWSTVAGLMMLAFAALAVLASRRLAELRRIEAIAAQTPPVPPLEAAFSALSVLEREDLPAAGRFKEFYQRASDILRRYIHDALDVDALDSTRRELDLDLEGIGLPGHIRDRVEARLAESDLVKFARLRPNQSDAEQFLPEVRASIEHLDAWSAPIRANHAHQTPDVEEIAEDLGHKPSDTTNVTKPSTNDDGAGS